MNLFLEQKIINYKQRRLFIIQNLFNNAYDGGCPGEMGAPSQFIEDS